MKSIIFPALLCGAVLTGVAQTSFTKLSPRARLAVQRVDTVNAYIRLTPGARLTELPGLKVVVRAGDLLTARIPTNLIDEVAKLPEVQYIQASAPAAQMLDVAKAEAGISRLTDTSNPAVKLPYDGTGVVVGVIDAGFDYLHESFTATDGTLRISRVWEQNGTPGTYPAPAKYGYGIELTTPEKIREAAGDISGNSHGTHVAAIAAGSSAFRDGRYAGIAPGSEIVLVSMGDQSRDNVNISNGIDYIFEYAKSVNKPCVINLSLGNQAGPHDGTSMFDQMADALSGPGRLIVGAAGNHGNDLFHINHTFASAEDAPLQTFLDYKSNPTTKNVGGDVELWADATTPFAASLLCVNTATNTVFEELPIDMTSTEAQTLTFSKNVTGDYNVACEVSPLNGRRHILISSAVTNFRNNYRVALRITPQGAGTVDIWADNIYLGLSSLNKEGFTAPDPKTCSTIAEIGGTARSILSVGSYTTRPEYTIYGSSTPFTLAGETLGAFSTFSGYGPTVDGRLKPEVTAPGCFIISSGSANDSPSAMFLADVNDTDANHTNYYCYMQGTSMAAPFVTGIVATWLQANPELTPDQLHQIAAGTARPAADTENPNRWGAGKIDAYAGLMQALNTGIHTPTHDATGTIKYYDLQGMPVATPATGQLLIRVQGSRATKVLIP